jgi:hypothetical protein
VTIKLDDPAGSSDLSLYTELCLVKGLLLDADLKKDPLGEFATRNDLEP